MRGSPAARRSRMSQVPSVEQSSTIDQFALHVFGQRRGQHQRQAALDHGALVVDGNQDGQEHAIPQYNGGRAPQACITELSNRPVLETNVCQASHSARPRKGTRRLRGPARERLLIVATDRISAFDYILATGIPDKGRVLTQMTLFWLDFLSDMVPNHLISRSDRYRRSSPYRDELEGRSMWVQRRKCSTWSAWRADILPAPAGRTTSRPARSAASRCRRACAKAMRLPEPIFTPATKAKAATTKTSRSSDGRASVGGELTGRCAI